MTAALDLARQIQARSQLLAALRLAGPVLACWIGATDWVALRVVGGGADDLLVQPWVESTSVGEERSIDLDVDALVPVADADWPLGRALIEGHAQCGPVPGAAAARAWRPERVRRAAVLPVCLGLRSLAALEFHDPSETLAEGGVLAACFDLIALQLAQAAQREEAQRARAAHAEQYGRLAMLTTRTARHAVITDADGIIEWVHPALARATGYGTIDLRGRPLWEVLVRDADDLRPAVQLRERFQAGGAFRLEFMARRGAVCLAPDEVYWLEVDAQVAYDQASGRLQFLCLCRDVSERVQRRLGMDEGREILAALTDNLPISLVALDACSLAVMSLNRHAEEEFGVEADGFGSGTIDSVPTAVSAAARAADRGLDQEPVPALGPGLAELIAPQLREAVGTEVPVEHEFAWSSPRGERIVAARHVVVARRHGAPRIVISQLRDVTQLRRSEQILRESEQRYRELVESIEEGVFVTDPRSDTHHYLSPRALDMLGVDAYDVHLGGLLEPRVEPEDLPLLQAQRASELRQAPSDVTLRVRHPTRGLRWIRRRTRTRPLPNGDLRVYGLLDDVTDQREQALQLQAAHDAAEAASQAKGRFLATMSHEIRTPMNGILGMTELLLGTALSERQRRFAQAVYRSGEGLLGILNDVLDFAKIEAGRLELQLGVVSLRQLVDDTLELLAPRAHAKGLALSLHVAAGVPERISADGLRLQQVITNLLSNAIKFTEHGEVAVRLDCETPAANGRPWRLACTVRDTGIGIAPQAQSHLFQAFVQAHDGMARRYGGTGLGLAISKQLVELMAGAFQVDSRPGEGSSFRFTFEAGEVEGAGDAVAGDSALPDAVVPGRPLASWRGRRALVAAAHAVTRRALSDVLQAMGLLVDQAEDEAALRRQLAASIGTLPRWALVLVDRDLPGSGGVELLQALRCDARLVGTQWLLLSDLSGAGEPLPVALGDGVRLLHKPVRRDELYAALADLPSPGRPPMPVLPRLDLRVLVVEDHPINQEVMAQMLRRCGAEVCIAASGHDGLQALRTQRFDLVLMDIQMPELDGIQALRRWRAMAACGEPLATRPDTPVIAVTAHALGEEAQRLLDEGFQAYLPKPFRLAELLQLLLRLLPAATATGLCAAGVASTEGDGISEVFGEGIPLLDPAAQQRLRRLDPQGQNRLVERVMAAFEASLDRVLTQVGPLRAQGDARGLHAVVHTLKSASGHVGALLLAALCQRCEPQLRAGRLSQELDAALDELLAEVRRLREGLRGQPAAAVEVDSMVAAG